MSNTGNRDRQSRLSLYAGLAAIVCTTFSNFYEKYWDQRQPEPPVSVCKIIKKITKNIILKISMILQQQQ